MLAADAAPPPPPPPPPPPVVARAETVGRSVLGRPIRLLERGDGASGRVVLVVGCIHGNECAGLAVTRRLRKARPTRYRLLIVPDLNPDGRRAGTRQNARGVDLNRNFRAKWRSAGRPWDPLYTGPRAFSEPESRAARHLILEERPDVTIWFHQPQSVVRAWGRSRKAARRYARAAGEPYRSMVWPHGSGPRWQNQKLRRGFAYVVELPPGPLPDRRARVHARAVKAIGRG